MHLCKYRIDDADNWNFHHFDMATALGDIDTAIEQLTVKERVAEQKIADHDRNHNAEHGSKGKFIT